MGTKTTAIDRVRHSLNALLAACLLQGCCANAAAAMVWQNVRPVDDSVVIQVAASVPGDRATAWHVLTDYARYPRFVPGLLSSRIVERSGGDVRVEQRGDAGLGPLRKKFDVVYAIEEHPESLVRSQIVSGCDCTLQSRYTLTASGATLRLAYSGRLSVGGSMGRLLEQGIAEQWIIRHFQALVAEIERQSREHARESRRHRR